MARLDRMRDFGQVLPPEGKIHFWQDGCYFDNEGKFVCRDGDEQDEIRQIVEAPAVAKVSSPEDEEIDLAAWARGEKKHVFFRVLGRAKESFPDADLANKANVLDILVKNGVVALDEVNI